MLCAVVVIILHSLNLLSALAESVSSLLMFPDNSESGRRLPGNW